MILYETPEVFELGSATALTLGDCKCGDNDNCGGCRKDGGDVVLA